MGQASRTTKLLLDLGKRDRGGANSQKRAALHATAEVLTQARAFYLDFFLAHADKLSERVTYYSEEHLEMRERLLSAHELLSWAEGATVETREHPHPWEGWNFTVRFPGMPFASRRSVIKDARRWSYDPMRQSCISPRSGRSKPRRSWSASKIKPDKGSKSRRLNRRRANQLRGKINQHARDKAYLHQIVTVEVNSHGTSQYCSRCVASGERFSYRGGQRIVEHWGKLFYCPVCHFEAHADFNASVNVHRSLYREWHWQPRKGKAPKTQKVVGLALVRREDVPA
jgi:hypothetical protein